MKKKLSVFTLSLGSGGTEKFISLMLPKLVYDYEVYLVLVHNIRHFEIPQNVKIVVLNSDRNLNIFEKIVSFPIIIKKYILFLSSNNIDISLSLLTRPNIINSFVKFFHKNIKVILSERCYPSIAYKSSRFRFYLYKLLIPFFYNKADAVFSNSLHINNDLLKNFGVHKPMNLIYNPITLFPVEEITKDNKQFDIVWIGKLVDIKNPMMLLRAIKESNRFYNVQILGTGNLEAVLESISPDNIYFRGNVSNVFEYIKQSKCLVLTSNSEGFPNVILEGMSYGLPIIATNCTSGPLEILNDNKEIDISPGDFKVVKFGILVNVDDSSGLAKAINKLFTDQELYSKLANLSYSRAKDFTIENSYNELRRILIK